MSAFPNSELLCTILEIAKSKFPNLLSGGELWEQIVELKLLHKDIDESKSLKENLRILEKIVDQHLNYLSQMGFIENPIESYPIYYNSDESRLCVMIAHVEVTAQGINYLDYLKKLASNPQYMNTSCSSLTPKEELHNCFINAYDKSTLKMMLSFRLQRNLDELVNAQENFNDIIFHLIEAAERQGWIEDLILEAHKYNPRNRQLADFSQRIEQYGYR